MTPVDPIEKILWSYVRGDAIEAEFEAWVYQEPRLEALLGDTDWIELVTLNFRDSSSRSCYDRRCKVRELVDHHFPRVCDCQAASRCFRRDIGYSQLGLGPPIARRTPWIELRRCGDCGTYWMIGVDTVDDSVTHVRVSSQAAEEIAGADHWPTEFDEIRTLWPDE